MRKRRLRPPIFYRFPSPRQRPPADCPCRAAYRRLYHAADAARQVSVAAVAFACAQFPAIFTDHASSRPLIRRDKNARRTRGQMQRKV
ncbi:hypothetical protein OH687_13685 [Burkholderia anthina]|nr:hypothetical protein OH687_13685 [Burkholderia anthina]